MALNVLQLQLAASLSGNTQLTPNIASAFQTVRLQAPSVSPDSYERLEALRSLIVPQSKPLSSSPRQKQTINAGSPVDPDIVTAPPRPAAAPASPPPRKSKEIALPMGLQVGDLFDASGVTKAGTDGKKRRYKLDSIVAKGGQGVFLKVLDTKLGRFVGLKVLRHPDDLQAVREFLNEMRIGAMINSDHLAPVHDVIEFADGTLGMLTRLIDGKPLKGSMSGLTYKAAIATLLDICTAITDLHNAGIIHRDLKPDNVIIEPNGRAIVIDLGIAESLDKIDPKSPTISGTPGYIHPLDRGVGQDLYSLGMILLQLMSKGRHPFYTYGNDGAVLQEKPEVIQGRANALAMGRLPVPKPTGYSKKEEPDYVHGAVCRIIERCIGPDRPQNFRSVAELMEALISIQVTALRGEIDAIERRIDDLMTIEWSSYLKAINFSLDPSLDVSSRTEEQLSDLLGTPVIRRNGRILVYAPTREHLPPDQRLESEVLAEELKKTVNLWQSAIESMANLILEKRWPLGDAIARRSFELLEYREFDLSAEEKAPLIERIRHYEKACENDEGPMTKALTRPLSVELVDVRDYEEDRSISANFRPVKIKPIFKIRTEKDPATDQNLEIRKETGQNTLGPDDEVDPLNMAVGFGEVLVLQFRGNENHADVDLPVQVPLAERRRLVESGEPIRVVAELVQSRSVPAGHKVVHGGRAFIGVHYGSKDPRYGIHQREIAYPPFAAKIVTLGDYRLFLESLVKQGLFREAALASPRTVNYPFVKMKTAEGETEARNDDVLYVKIDERDRTVAYKSKDPRGNEIDERQLARGLSPANIYAYGQWTGLRIIQPDLFPVIATGGIRGWAGPVGAVKAVNLHSTNGTANWGKTSQSIKVPLPTSVPPRVDPIPGQPDFNENQTLINGFVGLFGLALFVTGARGPTDTVVTEGAALSATSEAIGFDANRRQTRHWDNVIDASSPSTVTIKKFSRKK